MAPWTDAARVKGWLRLGDQADDDLVAAAVGAVNPWVTRLPHLPTVVPPPPTDPAEVAADPLGDVRLGATMLAARWYRRRNTPGGIDSVTDVGAVYVPRRDADVDALLGLGAYAPPGLG